jgi:hypothetical protein
MELLAGETPFGPWPETVCKFEQTAACKELPRVRWVYRDLDGHISFSTNADGFALAA